jgi:hypothetical protein
MSMRLGRTAPYLVISTFILCMLLIPDHASSAVTGGGRMVPLADLSEDRIWREGSGNAPNVTSVTLTVSGGGDKGITLAPQDVVFLMDHSGSLGTYDPQVLRILATHRYVDNMVAPYDRASLIKFDSIATTFNHLTSAYPQVHADLDALSVTEPQGQTNFQSAITAASNELVSHGVEGNQRVILFFTDGTPDPPEKNVTMGQMDTLVMNGIKVYTIGLGPMVDGSLLGWMADYTGGRYYLAQTAEELVGIYLNISDQFYDYTAGTACTLFAELDPDIEFVEGSSSIADDFTSQWNDGHWRLVWSVGALRIGSNWTVTFNVTSPDGSGKLKLFQAGSTIEYADWRGENRSAGLPDVYLTVLRGLPPPLPPPPTPPPPAAMAPVPPPPSVPVVAPTVNVAPVITATPNITPVTIGQAGSVPVEYMLAGLAALGIADRINLKKKIIEKQRVSVGA